MADDPLRALLTDELLIQTYRDATRRMSGRTVQERLVTGMDAIMRDVLRPAFEAAMPTWQPIETAPKDREVLVYDEGAVMVSAWVEDHEGQAGWWDNGIIDPPPSHWMPLPAPPKEPTDG